MEGLEKTPETKKEYAYKTRKVENILSGIMLVLFIMSFNEKAFSAVSVMFYALCISMLVYYFKWFKKKPMYVKILSDKAIFSRGLFFKLEEVALADIKNVDVQDKKIEVTFMKNGSENKLPLFNILLDEEDRKSIIRNLRQGV